MEARVNIERKHAFVLTLANVKTIWDLFQSRVGTVTCTAKCADGIDRTFHNLKQLQEFNNPPQKRITHFSLDARSTDLKKSVDLEFSDGSWRTINLRLAGIEQGISKLYDDINDVLDGLRPWYSNLARVDFFHVIGSLFLFAILVFQVYVGNKPNTRDSSITVQIAVLVAVIVIGIFVGIGVSIWLLNKLRARYFPMATYALGQGEDRFHIDEKIRWTILVGFIVSLVASLVVAVINIGN